MFESFSEIMINNSDIHILFKQFWKMFLTCFDLMTLKMSSAVAIKYFLTSWIYLRLHSSKGYSTQIITIKTILSSLTHPRVVPNLHTFLSWTEHKRQSYNICSTTERKYNLRVWGWVNNSSSVGGVSRLFMIS